MCKASRPADRVVRVVGGFLPDKDLTWTLVVSVRRISARHRDRDVASLGMARIKTLIWLA